MLAKSLGLVLASWLVESVVLRVVLGRRFAKRQWVDLFWINALTNPLANLAYSSWNCSWIVVELLVVLAEVYPIRESVRLGYKQALFLSFLANGVSAGVGLLWEWSVS